MKWYRLAAIGLLCWLVGTGVIAASHGEPALGLGMVWLAASWVLSPMLWRRPEVNRRGP